jgi:dolichyl-diphosphooligosaccharide--protein glycosyltransferase
MFGSFALLGLAIRSLRYPTVFSTIGVQLPYPGDSYYHLRRIWFSVARFPESLAFDRYASFPEGSQIPWPAAFDWTIAAAIRPFVDPADQSAVEALAVWVPALLGAANTGLIALFAARFYGRAAGWYAGLLYSVMPIGFVFSQLGVIDHHVAVALLSTSMLWLAAELFSKGDRAERLGAARRISAVGLSAALGLSMAITLLVWPGSLLHIGVLQVALGLRWLMAEDPAAARSRAVEFSISQFVLAIGIAPFALGNEWTEFGTWSPLVLSVFQPAYFGCAATLILGVQLLHEHASVGDTRRRRFISALVAALIGGLTALVVLPSLRESLLVASGWFTGGEELLAQISEMQPIFWRWGLFDLRFAIQNFGAGFLVLPLVWVPLIRRAARERSQAQGLILLWSLVFFVLTLDQWRFGNTFAGVYAVLIGALIAQWLPGLRRRLRLRSPRPAFEALAFVVLVSWTVVAFHNYYRHIVESSLGALRNQRVRALGPLHPSMRIYDQAGRWLARTTPETAGYLDASAEPEYAVLCDWAVGHLLRYRSERPMVQDNFGPYAGRDRFESAWAYFAERDEAAALEILDRLGVRYVVAGPTGAGSVNGLAADSMARRLGTAFGSAGQRLQGKRVPGLSRHRIIFFAHAGPAGGSRSFARLGIWETVRGAQIEGHAEPGHRVVLSLDLATSSQATHVYRREVIVDDQGRYRFVVPYPTDVRFSPDVTVPRSYRIRGPRASGKLDVREQDVIGGATLRGPDL